MSTPPAPLTLSWSQLRTAEECRQKLYLIRRGHRSARQNLRNYYHGMVVDRVMRDWLADPQRQPGQMAAAVPAAIAAGEKEAIDTGDGVVRWKHAGDKAEMQQFCTELVVRLEPILAEHILPYKFFSPFRFKVPVKLPYLDGTPTMVYLIGEMDLLVQRPDGYAVWDLKGTKDDQYYRKVLGQLFFYDLALYAMHGTPATEVGLIQPMCTQQVMPATVTDDNRRDIWTRILRLATTIWSHDATCKEGTGGCQWCEVNHACARYSAGPDSLSAGLLAAAREQT